MWFIRLEQLNYVNEEETLGVAMFELERAKRAADKLEELFREEREKSYQLDTLPREVYDRMTERMIDNARGIRPNGMPVNP
jgi:hypothetical protein